VLSNAGRTQYCACTQTSGVRLSVESYYPSQSKLLWTLVQVPDAAATTVQVANFPKLAGVPLNAPTSDQGGGSE
jgi:hypothetical protein